MKEAERCALFTFQNDFKEAACFLLGYNFLSFVQSFELTDKRDENLLARSFTASDDASPAVLSIEVWISTYS